MMIASPSVRHRCGVFFSFIIIKCLKEFSLSFKECCCSVKAGHIIVRADAAEADETRVVVWGPISWQNLCLVPTEFICL